MVAIGDAVDVAAVATHDNFRPSMTTLSWSAAVLAALSFVLAIGFSRHRLLLLAIVLAAVEEVGAEHPALRQVALEREVDAGGQLGVQVGVAGAVGLGRLGFWSGKK